MKIAEQYLVKTQYGLNLLVLTEGGDFYQQVHNTLCHDGGGVATWTKIEGNAARGLIYDTSPIFKST